MLYWFSCKGAFVIFKNCNFKFYYEIRTKENVHLMAGVIFEVNLSLPTFMAVSWKLWKILKLFFTHNLDHKIIIFIFCCFKEYAGRKLNQKLPREIIKQFFIAYLKQMKSSRVKILIFYFNNCCLSDKIKHKSERTLVWGLFSQLNALQWYHNKSTQHTGWTR